MLDIETAREIGITACIDKLGREFVLKNKDFATKAFGENEDGVFCFVGVDKGYNFANSDNALILDNVSRFTYRVSCNVSLEDGKVIFIED